MRIDKVLLIYWLADEDFGRFLCGGVDENYL